MTVVRVVEDDEQLAWLLHLIVTTRGHMDCHVTFEHFYQLLTPEPWQGVDVAVLDLMLPGTRGEDILGWLAVHEPHIRRIVLSAKSRMLDPADAALAHVVMEKPWADTEALLAAIRG